MSANLDLVRSIFAPWERGDYSSAEWAHPEIECVSVDGPEPGTWTGLEGMAVAIRTFLSAWQDAHQDLEELREIDGERILALYRWTARGKASGLETGQIHATAANLFHIHGGKVTTLVVYLDRERALADLGLKE